jgi:hypothetical protein
MLLGKKYAAGVIVTQVVPALEGHSSLVLDYKSALANSRSEHQGVHKVWGTQIDADGHYQAIDLQ